MLKGEQALVIGGFVELTSVGATIQALGFKSSS